MSAIKCKLINVAYLYIQKYRDIMLLALKSICGSKGNGLLTILIKKNFLMTEENHSHRSHKI